MKAKVNGKIVDGAAGTAIGCATIFFIGAIFLFVALLLLSPIIIPILVGVLIGKAL